MKNTLKNGKLAELGLMVLAVTPAGQPLIGRIAAGPDAGVILVKPEYRPADGGEFCGVEECVTLEDALMGAGALEAWAETAAAMEKGRVQLDNAMGLIEEQTGALQSARARIAELETEVEALKAGQSEGKPVEKLAATPAEETGSASLQTRSTLAPAAEGGAAPGEGPEPVTAAAMVAVAAVTAQNAAAVGAVTGELNG